MRIVIVCQSYPSKGNQMFVFVEQLVNAMIEQGVDITVIAPQSLTNCLVWHIPILPNLTYKDNGKGKKYKVYRPKYLSFGNCKGPLESFSAWIEKQSILSILRKKKFDVVYAHFWSMACLVSDYCRKHNIPLFVACGEGDSALEDLVKQTDARYRETLKGSVAGVISVSSENKRKCIAYGLAEDSKITVLPNSVDTTLFFPYDVAPLKKELGITDNDFVVSFVGGFIERKGSKRLADAITLLDDDSVKSIFVGRTLSNDVAIPDCQGIVYRGPLEHSRVPDYLNCSDVFVLPTQNEGCSNAIVEALACGIPVISSNGAFNDDILTEENSIRIDPNNVEAIANAISEIRQKRNARQLLTDKISVENPYSIEKRASKIITFIENRLYEN